MALTLCYEDDVGAIRDAMAIIRQEWPGRDLLQWAESPEWAARHAHWWQVWEGDRWLGYIAAVDLNRGRWAFHFGCRRRFDRARAMLEAWDLFLKVAEANGVRILAAYIPLERPEIRRAARIFNFRRFSETLWVYLVEQKCRQSLPHPSPRRPSRRRTSG